MNKSNPPLTLSIGTALLILMAAFFLRTLHPEWLRILELKLYDARYSFLSEAEYSDRVVVVDLDQESFARYGPWPWNRTNIARLALNLAEQQPLSVGWNIIFADRYSDMKAAGSQDAILRDAFKIISQNCPQLLGYHLNFRGQPSENLPLVKPAVFSRISEGLMSDSPSLRKAEGASGVIPDFAQVAYSQAFCAVQVDVDGAVRSAPMAFEYNKMFMMPLSLAAINSGKQESSIRFDAGGVTGIKVGEDWIRPSFDGTLLLRFPALHASIPHIPAWEIMEKRNIRINLFGKTVFVGSTAVPHQKFSTPTGGKVSAVDIEAIAAETLLGRSSPAYYPDWGAGLEIAAIFAISLLSLIMALPMTHRRRFAVFLCLFFGYGLFNCWYLFMIRHWVIDLGLPLAVVAANYALLTLGAAIRQKSMRTGSAWRETR